MLGKDESLKAEVCDEAGLFDGEASAEVGKEEVPGEGGW